MPAALLLAVVLGLASLWFLSKPSGSSRGSAGPPSPVSQAQRDVLRRTAKDDSGRQWELLVWGDDSGGGRGGAARPESDLAKPLVGTVVTRKQGPEQVWFLLTVETAAGRRVRSVTVAGGRPPEPTFSITDASGKEVASGKFEYG